MGGLFIVFFVLLIVCLTTWGPDMDRARAKNVAPADATRSLPLPTVAPTLQPTVTASPAYSNPLEPSPSPTPSGTVRLLFTGDINPGRCPAAASLLANDFTLPYRYVAQELRSADLTIGSLDGSISDLIPPEPCSEIVNLIGPSRTTEGLNYAGFDVMTVATNHALDCGSLGWRCDGRALNDTLLNLLSAGILPIGIGSDLTLARAPHVVEVGGVRFAFLGINAISGEATWADSSHAGTAPLSDGAMAEVAADIATAHRLADVVIVLPHWGVEYASEPDASQRTWAAQLVAAGADLVIGNHPHIAQPVQIFPNGSIVAYALGNFVFDQGTKDTQQGLVFEAVYRGTKLESWRLLPVRINKFFQPTWTSPAETQAILERLAQASQFLAGR